MKTGKTKLAHLIYDFIQKGHPRSLREVFLEFEKTIEPDRATRTYNRTLRKEDRAKERNKPLSHYIFYGKKRIIIKSLGDLVRRGVVEKSADSKNPWDRFYRATDKEYTTRRGQNKTTQPAIEQQKSVPDEKVASSKDTHFTIALPLLPEEPEKRED